MKRKENYKLTDNIIFSIKMLADKDKSVILFIIISSIVGMLLPFFSIYFPKYVIEKISSGSNHEEIVVGIGIFSVALGAMYFIDKFLTTKIYWHLIVIQAEHVWDIYMKSITCSYQKISNSNGQSLYQRAMDSVCRGDLGCIRIMIPAILNIVIGLLGMAIYGILLCQLSIWLLLFTASLSIPSILISFHVNSYEKNNKKHWVEIDKKINYFVNKSIEPSFGKDIRMFSMESWISSIINNLLALRKNWYNKVETRKSLALYCNSLIIFIRDSITYIFLIWSALNGYVDVGDFILYFGIVATFSQWTNMIVEQISKIGLASNLVTDYRSFMEQLNDNDKQVNNKNYKTLSTIKNIEFQDVCFSYDGKTNIINHLNLKIGENENIGIVGINGAGKTTLVKLLCGLYEPTRGKILINGYPNYIYKPKELLMQFSAVFQDSSLFPFTFAENISMKSAKKSNLQRVNEAIHNANLIDKVQLMYNGINSEMLKIIDDKGIYLSGGEMQKLFLSRALYRNGSVFLLDEPTSALDPLAEKEQYLKYSSICNNKIAVYISHRISSVTFCDKIAYMENGEIVEYGSHIELMKKNGKYAKMFHTQSSYYV